MKTSTIPMLLMFIALGCNQSEENASNNQNPNLPAQDILNVAYGNDAEQKMDIYLPAARNIDTKVIILVHGGGWSGGSKADFNYVIPTLKLNFPEHAIVNMNYRLGTTSSPGFPKQIQDIEKLVQHLKNSDYSISEDYAFIGASAGAHLSMLYAYHYDPGHDVKAVASIVGPTDFTDPVYTGNPLYQYGLLPLVGNVNYQQNPEVFIEVSPATHVSAQSPATIMFYGGQDPLVPATQAPRLKEKLDQFGVYNEMYIYANGGHGNWDIQTMADFTAKLITFLHDRF
ncbi:MAG TPA: alpha/beta hydrolase [Flavobacterium sp.]